MDAAQVIPGEVPANGMIYARRFGDEHGETRNLQLLERGETGEGGRPQLAHVRVTQIPAETKTHFSDESNGICISKAGAPRPPRTRANQSTITLAPSPASAGSARSASICFTHPASRSPSCATRRKRAKGLSIQKPREPPFILSTLACRTRQGRERHAEQRESRGTMVTPSVDVSVRGSVKNSRAEFGRGRLSPAVLRHPSPWQPATLVKRASVLRDMLIRSCGRPFSGR